MLGDIEHMITEHSEEQISRKCYWGCCRQRLSHRQAPRSGTPHSESRAHSWDQGKQDEAQEGDRAGASVRRHGRDGGLPNYNYRSTSFQSAYIRQCMKRLTEKSSKVYRTHLIGEV